MGSGLLDKPVESIMGAPFPVLDGHVDAEDYSAELVANALAGLRRAVAGATGHTGPVPHHGGGGRLRSICSSKNIIRYKTNYFNKFFFIDLPIFKIAIYS